MGWVIIWGGCWFLHIQIRGMEVRSERDKSELSYNDSSTLSAKSLKLGLTRPRIKSLSSSASKLETATRDNLLASIGKRPKANNIQLVSRQTQRMSENLSSEQVAISCFPQLPSLSPLRHLPAHNYLEYQQLLQRPKPEGFVLQGVHLGRGERVGCFQQSCEVRRRWIRSILFYERQLKNLYLLRERRGELPRETAAQIEKDIERTFPAKTVTKTKINVVQSQVEKYDLLEALRQVLKLYAAFDSSVGYVQGMNMVAAPIVIHMREVNAAFIYFKEVMTYGKLRLFFVDDFQNIKVEVRQKFRKILRFHNGELYHYLEMNGVDYTMFVPYYITLFATLVDIAYMHIVINEFMRGGINFLHKLFLVLLLFLKERIIEDRQGMGVMGKLGASYIKSLEIDWKTMLMLTFHITIE